MESLSNPESLRDRDDIPFHEETRTFDREQFDGLRDRYQRIDGVVMYGVTDDDGRVLLLGPAPWVPPGGDVRPGEDWVAATHRVVRELWDVAVEVERPELVECSEFRLADDPDERFAAHVVHFRASLVDDAPGFLDDPSFVDGLDHHFYGDGSDAELAWFQNVPGNVHESHEDHVRLYFD